MMAHAAPRNRNRRLSRRGQILLLRVLYILGALQSTIILIGFVRIIWTVWTALGVN